MGWKRADGVPEARQNMYGALLYYLKLHAEKDGRDASAAALAPGLSERWGATGNDTAFMARVCRDCSDTDGIGAALALASHAAPYVCVCVAVMSPCANGAFWRRLRGALASAVRACTLSAPFGRLDLHARVVLRRCTA